MKLISMTDFVLEQSQKIEDLHDNLCCAIAYNKIENYANFLKQPLELGMFVPCDEDGNVLLDGVNWNKNFYNKAKERCLFEGFEYVNEDFIHNTIHYFIRKEDSKIMWNFNNEWRFYPEFKTIEDLVKYDSKLTSTAIKQLGL